VAVVTVIVVIVKLIVIVIAAVVVGIETAIPVVRQEILRVVLVVVLEYLFNQVGVDVLLGRKEVRVLVLVLGS